MKVELKLVLKAEYEKIMMANNIHPYTEEQMKITKFVDKLIGMISNKWEVMASGEFSDNRVIKKDSMLLADDFMKRLYKLGLDGKNIEVAVREVSNEKDL